MLINEPKRFPKIHSPYKRRENDNEEYVLTPEHEDGYEWVNDPEQSIAIEKIHGTNCAIRIINNKVYDVWTRMGNKKMNLAHPFNEKIEHQRVVRAVQNSITKGIIPSQDGVYFGETIGRHFHDNMYDLDKDYFIPFKWAKRKLRYTSWGKYSTDYEGIKSWLRNDIFSLLYQYFHGCSLDEASVKNGRFVEGIMFYKKDEANPTIRGDEHVNSHGFAKIRRDMFEGCQDWNGPILEH